MSKVKGLIYILSNPEMQGLVKIGQTQRTVEERVAELSSGTGVPAPYEIEAIFDSKNPIKAEKRIHAALAAYRTNPHREFFRIDLETAIQVAMFKCQKEPRYLDRLKEKS